MKSRPCRGYIFEGSLSIEGSFWPTLIHFLCAGMVYMGIPRDHFMALVTCSVVVYAAKRSSVDVYGEIVDIVCHSCSQAKKKV